METKPDLASRGLTIGRNGETVEPWKQGTRSVTGVSTPCPAMGKRGNSGNRGKRGNGEREALRGLTPLSGKPAFLPWLGQSEISPVFVPLGVFKQLSTITSNYCMC